MVGGSRVLVVLWFHDKYSIFHNLLYRKLIILANPPKLTELKVSRCNFYIFSPDKDCATILSKRNYAFGCYL